MKKNILIMLAAMLLVFAACVNKGNLQRITSLYPNDDRMWKHIFEVGEPYKFESSPLGVIIPHHLAAAFEIARFYEGLAAIFDPSIIVIIGPNHYENGKAHIQTCTNCVYETTQGDVELDLRFVESMILEGIATEANETFKQEHAIFSHTPFIKNTFPKVKIVPILLWWEMPIEELKILVNWLDANLPDDALVIASVDFSHYIPIEAADFHDQSSYATIKNFDFENIYDLEVDSPSSLYALLSLMKKRSYMKAERLEHTNLNQFVSDHPQETTSHQFFAFFEGDVEPVEGASIMSLVGIVDQELGLIDNWNWDRDESNNGDLRDLVGTEDRFLTGADFLVFDLEYGCKRKQQNGLEIDFCRYFEGIEDLDLGEADITYMLSDDERAKQLTDVVDILVMEDMVKVGGFELSDLQDLNKIIFGIFWSSDFYEIYIFPIETIMGYPKLKNYEERVESFEELMGDAVLPEMAEVDFEKGIVKIKR